MRKNDQLTWIFFVFFKSESLNVSFGLHTVRLTSIIYIWYGHQAYLLSYVERGRGENRLVIIIYFLRMAHSVNKLMMYNQYCFDEHLRQVKYVLSTNKSAEQTNDKKKCDAKKVYARRKKKKKKQMKNTASKQMSRRRNIRRIQMNG